MQPPHPPDQKGTWERFLDLMTGCAVVVLVFPFAALMLFGLYGWVMSLAAP